jgi:gp16 family phage-associated protein
MLPQENITMLLRNVSQVRSEFSSRGLSISGWARVHGYSAQLVYGVLTGRNRALRGQSHEIAVRLGLKRGLIGHVSDIDAFAQQPKGPHPPPQGSCSDP